MPIDFSFDYTYIKKYGNVTGFDEAGRGPLAGPVFSACVSLDENTYELVKKGLPFLDDSKKLTKEKRKIVHDFAIENKIPFRTGISTEEEIDDLNILNATALSMERAYSSLGINTGLALVDGKCLRLFFPNIQIVRGDCISASIAFASNIAKHLRDKYMKGISESFPEYYFEKNKGYGTKEHIERIIQFGPIPVHRFTFNPVCKFLNPVLIDKWEEEGLISKNRIISLQKKERSKK